MLNSLFNKVAGLQTCTFIKEWLQHRCVPVNVANILRTAFSIEDLGHLLLILQEREEEESMKKEGTKNFSNEKRKSKHFL